MSTRAATPRVLTVNRSAGQPCTGRARLGSSHPTKSEARAAGREYARDRQVEHIIRNLDGRIGERNTYGHDPRNIPG